MKRRSNKLANIVFEEIFINQLDLPFCIGCNQCFLKGEIYCPHASIMQSIVKKITTCDGLIITTPTYSLQVSGVLKCWLDHMSYCFHRPQFFTQKALVITTTAGAGAHSTARYVRNILHYWGINHVTLLPIRCFSFDYIPNQKDCKKIQIAANNFYDHISSKTSSPPNAKQIFLFNFWRSMAKSGEKENTADYRYWADMNLLNTPTPFDTPLSPTKKIWATLSYLLSKKMLGP